MTDKKLQHVKNYCKSKLLKSKDPQHGWDHPKRVAQNAIKITNLLGFKDEIDLNLLQAACLLHDINYATFSPGIINYFLEGRRTQKLLPSILNSLEIESHEAKIIENAIYSSSFSFPFRKLNKQNDLYSQILQDADTVDYFSDERQASLQKAKKSLTFYKILSLFSKRTIIYGRKNLHKYLNFPEIAKEFYDYV